MPQAVTVVVAALVRDGGVLLVRQQGPDDPKPSWALPGGVVESGELLSEALARELREETGLAMREIGPLVYTVQFEAEPAHLREAESGAQALAFVFEVRVDDGDIAPDDPDAFIQEARWVAEQEAIALLAQHPIRVMREPIVAYLRGEVGPGALWCYQRGVTEPYELVSQTVSAL